MWFPSVSVLTIGVPQHMSPEDPFDPSSVHSLLRELERLHQLESTAADLLQRVQTLRAQITAHLSKLDETSRARFLALQKEKGTGV